MSKIIFASNNNYKAEEIRSILKGTYEILTLKDAGMDINIPEPYDTLELNAKEKASVVYKLTGTNCFAEDSGLEVEALNGEPGVRSARYGGIHGDDAGNTAKLLMNMMGVEHRNARFRTVVCLIENGQPILFEGTCEGTISSMPTGMNGFGYDPIFIPSGYTKTFAECSLDEKNKISHRKKAIMKMIDHLLSSNKN